MTEEFKKKITVTEDRVTEKVRRCDYCYKPIVRYILQPDGTMKPDAYGKYYYEVFTGHHEWGNDSVDSFEHTDICSRECLEKVFEHYFEEIKRFPSMFIHVDRVLP